MIEAEQALGNAIKALGREREEYILATKANGDNLKPENLRKVFQRSLEYLNTDYIDLLQVIENLLLEISRFIGQMKLFLPVSTCRL